MASRRVDWNRSASATTYRRSLMENVCPADKSENAAPFFPPGHTMSKIRAWPFGVTAYATAPQREP